MKISKLLAYSSLFFLFLSYNYSIANISSEFINNIASKASNVLSSQESEKLKIEKLIKIGQQAVDILSLIHI